MSHVRHVVLSLVLALAACATPGGTQTASPSERVTALRDAMRLSKETTALLDSADAALKAEDREKAKGALTEAQAKLADPHMALSTKRSDLQKRAAAMEEQLKAPTPETAPVADAAPAAPAAPVAQAAPSAPAATAAPAAPASQETPAIPTSDTRKALADAMADVTKARAGLHGHELAKSDVETAEKSRDALSQALDQGKALAEKDEAYANKAKEGAQLLTDASDDIKLATLIADFVDGPGAAEKKGVALSKQAMSEHNMAKRRATLQEARDAFHDCEKDSLKMLSESPVLNRTALFLSTERTSPKKVASACAVQKKVVSKKIAAR